MEQGISRWFFAMAMSLFGGDLYAQEIQDLKVPQTRIPVGTSIPIQVAFNLTGVQNPFCGLEISYGDGIAESIRPGKG